MSPTKKKLLAAAKAEAEASEAMSTDKDGTTDTALPPVTVDAATMQDRAAIARAYVFSNDASKLPPPRKKVPKKVSPPQPFFATPLVRPTPPSNSNKQQKRKKPMGSQQLHQPCPSAKRKIPPVVSEEDDDYARFVKSLDMDLISLPPLPEEDNEDEYQMLDEDEGSDDDEDEMQLFSMEMEFFSDSQVSSPTKKPAAASAPTEMGVLSPLNLSLQDGTTGSDPWSLELEAELGGLLEEDLEAALHVLGNTNAPPSPAPAENSRSPPCTPMRETRSTVTVAQRQRLAKLFQNHYQLLVQQGLLAVRAAHVQKQSKHAKPDILGAETAEDLAEILDGAVGMLQDLNQNRKDAIRNSIQLEPPRTGGKRSLLPMLDQSGRRLTRSAFTKTLDSANVTTSFDVKGLTQLKQTFDTIDKSIQGGDSSLLEEAPRQACQTLLRKAGAHVEESMLPGARDLSLHFSHPKEVFGPSFLPPLTKDQDVQLRKNRNVFTAAEDNLVLRGVNLYGEKQWLLIADRYLPDRSVNIIAQRYSKLCLLVYQAQGVVIDDEGCLIPPPKNKNSGNLDEEALSKLKKVDPPAILNVHRWSLEEDLTLLKAVPLLGNMWAELSTRLIPHRDRGHLRKRYQVLERRVKATLQRSKRGGECSSTPRKPMSQPRLARKKSKLGTDAVAMPHHPGLPPHYLPHSAVPSAEVNRMPNGVMHPGAPPIRKPGFQLSARSRNGQMLPKASDAPKLANISKSNGQKPLSETPKLTTDSSGSPKTGVNAALPAASSPELDATAGTESSHRQDTRTGFERLLEEGTNDWSQMPRFKKMLENDTESMVAGAIVSKLSQAGERIENRAVDLERLPHIEVDSTTSSGFSMLNGEGEAASPTKASKGSPEGGTSRSIWASVFERTKSRPQCDANYEETNGSDHTLPLHVPSTPSRASGFPVPTTPIGLSPGMKSGFLSPAGFRTGFTPTGRMGFTPTGTSRMGLTPTGNSMAWNGGAGATSSDGYELCNFEISDRSRQAFESSGTDGPRNGGMSFGHPLTPSTAGLFGEGPNSLMANDFEAISALNSLSNSPARSLLMKKRPNPDTSFASPNPEKEGGQKISFFAKAIGGIHDKESKKRRIS